MSAGEVNGEDNYWVRARVELGDYGLPGSYMLDGDKWVWRDDRPLKPPSFKSVGFKYRADLQYLKHVLSYNDFRYRDHSDESKIEYRPFQPFSAVPDEGAALYLGWNGKLPNDPISLYVLLADATPEHDRRSRRRRVPQELLRRSRRGVGSRAARRLGVLRRRQLVAARRHGRHQELHRRRASSTSSGPTITARR